MRFFALRFGGFGFGIDIFWHGPFSIHLTFAFWELVLWIGPDIEEG